jgi:hypothetical protein
LECDDPQTLGEPCGYAIFKPSREGRTDISDGEVLLRINKVAAQRPWVGLTASTTLNMMPGSIPAEHDGALMGFARAIEAKLKEKNT